MSKKPAKGELSAQADDILDSLQGVGRSSSEVAIALAAEPASSRRDVLQALGDRARKRKFQANASEVVTLLTPIVCPGSANKPDFVPKYVRAVFECAQSLSSRDAREVGARLFVALVAAASKDGPKGASGLPFESLATIEGVISGFDAVLSSGHADQLASTRAIWIPLVPEIAVQRAIPLSEPAKAALVGLLGANQHELSAAARLSVLPLSQSDGAAAATGSVLGDTGAVAPPADASMLQEIRTFGETLRSLLLKLSEDMEARLAAQSRHLDRAEAAKAETALELKRALQDVDERRAKEASTCEELSALRRNLDDATRQLSRAAAELQNYKRHHDVAIADAESRENEAIARTKRSFVESQLVVLRSIRDCLAELSRTHGKERAVRQAASNFNNFSRFLSHSNYTGPGDLAKVESQSDSGADAS